MRISTAQHPGETVTTVELDETVEVAADGGYLRLWEAGKEIRLGPLTAEQAATLADDLGYLEAEV